MQRLNTAFRVIRCSASSLQAENDHRAFEKARMKKREVEEKDCQARLIKLEADSAERLRLSEELRETESLSRALNKKQSTVLQYLQKLDNSTDPKAYLLTFEFSMRESNFPADDWTTSSGNPSPEDHWRPIKIWMQRSRTRISNGNSWNYWDAPKLRQDRQCGGTCLRNSSCLGLIFPQS